MTSTAALSQHFQQQVLSQQEGGDIELKTLSSPAQKGKISYCDWLYVNVSKWVFELCILLLRKHFHRVGNYYIYVVLTGDNEDEVVVGWQEKIFSQVSLSFQCCFWWRVLNVCDLSSYVGHSSMRWSYSRLKRCVKLLWTDNTTKKSRPSSRPKADAVAEFSPTPIMIATPIVFHSTNWFVVFWCRVTFILSF